MYKCSTFKERKKGMSPIYKLREPSKENMPSSARDLYYTILGEISREFSPLSKPTREVLTFWVWGALHTKSSSLTQISSEISSFFIWWK